MSSLLPPTHPADSQTVSTKGFRQRCLGAVSSLSRRGLLASLGTLYLVAVVVLSLVDYRRARDREYERLNATLQAAGFALEGKLGRDFHDHHTLGTPLPPDEYAALTRELNLLATTMGLEYVYSMVLEDGKVRFVVSNETNEDLLRNTPSAFMSLYPDPPAELLEAFRTREARAIHFATYTNSWDSFYSIFIPRDTPRGKRYVLAADVKLEDRREILGDCLYRSAILVLLLLLPLVPIVLVQRALLETRERISRQEREHGDQIRRINSELEETVATRTAELQAALASLKGFSYSASHDLQAPLRAITGFALALKEDAAERLPPDARDHLERILSASRRMADLIDSLLEFAALAHADVAWEPIDASALARSVATELRQAGLGDRTDLLVEEGLKLSGDPRLMRLVLQNLLSNAFKYAREGADSRVEIRGGATKGGRWLEVRDNGIGFDMAHAAKLFHPFERLHGAGYEGHGIGLAQVARIVERHGGTAVGSSAPGEGATFRIEIPDRSRLVS